MDHKPFDMLITSLVIAVLILWSLSKVPEALNKTRLVQFLFLAPAAVTDQVEDLSECVGKSCNFKKTVGEYDIVRYDGNSFALSNDRNPTYQAVFKVEPVDPVHNTSYWFLRCDEEKNSSPSFSICRRISE